MELLYKDLEMAEKKLTDLKQKIARNGKDEEAKTELVHFEKINKTLNEKRWII